MEQGVRTALADLRQEVARVGRRAASPQAGDDRLFSPEFMARHTRFESIEAFCHAAPVEADGPVGVQSCSAEEFDRFVAETTDFGGWAAMRRTAAIEDAVDHVDGY